MILEDEEWSSKLLDSQTVQFFAPAIIIDTVNFKESQRGKKWDQIDF
jgi:hypothetical protein